MNELPEHITDAFQKINFSSISSQYGNIYVNGISIKFNYIAAGCEGKVYDISFGTKKETYSNLVIKITYKQNITEKNIMEFCSNNVKNGNTMNFLRLYSYKIEESRCIYLMEKAKGNLLKWFEFYHNLESWKSFIIQMLFGLDFLYKNNICHSDLKPKNIMYNIHSKPINIKYKNYILSTNVTFFIVDFGIAETISFGKHKLTDTEIGLCVLNHTDFYNIGAVGNKIKTSHVMQLYTFNELIEFIKSRGGDYIDSFIVNKRNDLNKQTSFSKGIKKNLLFKAVAYFAIKKYDIDLYTDRANTFKQKLPPKEVNLLLDRVFNEKDSIDFILNKYFSNDMIQK